MPGSTKDLRSPPPAAEPERHVATVDPFGSALGVVVAGGRAFVATRNALLVAALGVGAVPVLGGYSTGHSFGDLAVQGDRVYLAAGSNGLQILDASDPTKPAWVQTVPVDAAIVQPRGEEVLVVSGNALDDVMLRVVRLGGAQPTVEGGYPIGRYVMAFLARGDRGYALLRHEVRLLDLSDPARPDAGRLTPLPQPVQSRERPHEGWLRGPSAPRHGGRHMRGNRFGFLVVLLALAAACATFGGRGSADAPRMGQEELRARLGGPGVVVLDVRAFHDWEASGSRIAGAIREDPGGVGKWAGKYSPDQTLVLYCA